MDCVTPAYRGGSFAHFFIALTTERRVLSMPGHGCVTGTILGELTSFRLT